MADRFRETLARHVTGAVIQPGDRDVIREALESRIDKDEDRTPFLFDGWEWRIGSSTYPNWIGFTHLQKLLSHPGDEIHVHVMASQPDLENARKAVQKSINRAVGELVDQPDIRLHLQEHIKTGELCTYTGKLIWKFAP